ncbi:MAG: thiolase family protein [Alphaproteobacteria bacterium]|nr:thiolase family protein [Alphaproteobacteria bacterium]
MSDNKPSAALAGTTAMVGIGHSDWIADYAAVRAGTKPHDSFGYAAIAFNRALADAGIDKSEIDGLVAGPPTAHERMCEVLGIDPNWGTQADAMMGIQSAMMAIATGMCKVVALVYGNDQRSAAVNYGGSNAAGGNAFLSYIYHAPWGFTSQGALYAIMLRRFMHDTGFTERDLAEVAVAQRLHSSLNPHALMRKRVSVEDYMETHYVCEPLHLLDYCLINDGGVAFIMMSAERARRGKRKPAIIHGIGRHDLSREATSLEPRLTNFYRPAQKKVAEQVFNMAGAGPKDMSCLQIYDSFSVHIPLALEGYGYCGYGEAAKFFCDQGISLERGLPVNTSGGHLSESYMQGWNHQIEAVRQIRGECGERQVKDCRFVHYSSDVAGKALSIIYGH